MLKKYYIKSETVDRIRSSWIAPAVEQYVTWLSEQRYGARTVLRRIPLLISFGEYARVRGASALEQLPDHVEPFVETWVAERAGARAGAAKRKKVGDDVRNLIRQMLRLTLVNVR